MTPIIFRRLPIVKPGAVCDPHSAHRAAPRMDVTQLHSNIRVCELPTDLPMAARLGPRTRRPSSRRHRYPDGMGLLGRAPTARGATDPVTLDATACARQIAQRRASTRSHTKTGFYLSLRIYGWVSCCGRSSEIDAQETLDFVQTCICGSGTPSSSITPSGMPRNCGSRVGSYQRGEPHELQKTLRPLPESYLLTPVFDSPITR